MGRIVPGDRVYKTFGVQAIKPGRRRVSLLLECGHGTKILRLEQGMLLCNFFVFQLLYHTNSLCVILPSR